MQYPPRGVYKACAINRQSHPAAVKMRTAVLDWTKIGSKTSVKTSFPGRLTETEARPAFTLTSGEDGSFDYFDIEDKPKLVYIDLVPEAIFAGLEKSLDKFRLLISDELFQETLSLRCLSKRMSSLQPSFLPFGAVDLRDGWLYCCFTSTSKVMSGRSVNLTTLFLGRLMNRLPKKRNLSSITIFSIMPPGLL